MVEIARARIGTPIGTIGMIVEREGRPVGCYIYPVHLVGKPETVRTSRFRGKDLRVLK